MKVYVDSACDIHYSSFYIKGLQDVFGKNRIYFKNKYFLHFSFNNNFFAFILKDASHETKFIIDYGDSSEYDIKAMDWSDYYLKINIDENITYDNNKIISIGPSFGIKIYSVPKTLVLSISNFIKSRKRVINKRRFFSNYKAQLHRPKLEDYYPNTEEEKYIYFVGTIWKKETKTNTFRANYIKACLSKFNIKFEGGFAPRTKNDVQGYEALTMIKRESITNYVEKMSKSIVAFNTPAVLDCQGWKLGEFLCFGKAIISTSLTRKLPINLINEENILFTDGSQNDIENKLDEIISNNELRFRLKKNSRQYFEDELSPVKIISCIKVLHDGRATKK